MKIDERLVFYEGKYVRLKVLSEQDIIESDWVGWFNSEQMSKHNQHHYFPNTQKQQIMHLDSCSTDSKIQLGIIDRSDQSSICGVVSLSNINWIHRHAEIGGIQAQKTSTNSAIFLESWSLMLKHGFEQLGLKKIYGGTFHPHVVSSLERIFNFEIEGARKRHVFKNNMFYDLTLTAVFDDTIKYPEF